ncbi:PTS transporter subunit EIIC [Klebsiella sp. RHBSTW-00215]|uniref:PTS transporter subunit EIIC n=1 Tax=Klebsiella sp. RHBSTW-00215 TaxID=2742640 RepID=UPI0015F5C9BE|nr:PTS transporter subunit EIIC [Klebsiella sp. RHBSTW-00215]MBA7934308.1 PTS transporter subunit EIIC [Klebsiella sp. RHBSTW-00215]
MNPTLTAHEILTLAGGRVNITSVTHCMTRLRFVINDKGLVDLEGIRKVSGVLGAVDASGQLQIILGKNLIPVYTEVEKSFHSDDSAQKQEKTHNEKTKNNRLFSVVNNLIGFVASSVTPAVPGFIAGGMTLVLLLIVTLIFPQFKDSSSYTLLVFISQSAFYFMPVYIAYGAAMKLGSTPIYSMIASVSLIHPGFIKVVALGSPVTLWGVPVLLDSYASSFLPALMIAFTAAKLEFVLNKIVPGIFKAVFVGMFTVIIAGGLGFIILGPIGTYIGKYIIEFLMFLQGTLGGLSIALLAGFMPFIIMAGIHHLFSPIIIQSLASTGSDSLFKPALIVHNMAEGGACLGVAVRTKNKTLRSQAFSSGVGCILAGVTEPAIYGINLRLKRPLYGVMAGGFCGGLVAGLLGAKAFVMGYSNLLSIPIFQQTIFAIVSGICTAIIVSFVVTYIVGFDDVVEV